MQINTNYATTTDAITSDERAMLLRLAVSAHHWVRIDRRTARNAEGLRAAGLADIIVDRGRRYVGICGDAGELLATLAENPPADLTPPELRNLAAYRRQVAGIG